jgi:dimethylargininase
VPRIALVRPIPASLAHCELTYLAREPIDVTIAAQEHARYEELLQSLGCTLHHLPATPALPDSAFVEDTAVVVDEVAVLARPGAESRREEVASVADALAPYRPLIHIDAPGTLDGGDVLVAGHRVFVGLSRRTNASGVAQLHAALSPHGYEVNAVPVERCLHLKSAVTTLPDGRLLIAREWIDPALFQLPYLLVPDGESDAANVLHGGGRELLCIASAPRTIALLERERFAVIGAPQRELAKAEAGLTCCSVIFSG